MPLYSYVARAASGGIKKGNLAAQSPIDLQATLNQQGLRLVALQESITERKHSKSDYKTRLLSFRLFNISSRQQELMLQQLSVMLGSGMELTTSLRELGENAVNREVRKLCIGLAKEIENGASFHDAMQSQEIFQPLIIQLVRVGEATGELPVTLKRAAQYLENRREAVGHLVSALAYPTLVALAAIAVAVYMVGWAIPKLAIFLHAMGRSLPAMTQSLLDLSVVVNSYGIQVTIGGLSGIVGLFIFYQWPPGRYRLDRMILMIPILGSLFRMAETQLLASALSLMLRSGVLLQDALTTTARLHRNQYIADRVVKANERIAQGEDLARALKQGGAFEPMLASMVAVGERTGDLPNSLEHVSAFYTNQLGTRLKRISQLIEPAIIMCVGGVVGYVYVAFFMALLSTGGNFK